MFRLNNKGFSLVELMVVVAIIGILSSIAIPSINKYMAKARQSEAKTNLASIYTANKALYAEYTIYDSRFSVIGFVPEGKLRYNVGWAAAGTQCNLTQAGYTTTPPNTFFNSVAYCGTDGIIAGTETCTVLMDGNQTIAGSGLNCTLGSAVKTFTAAAAGRISSSTNIDQWTITHNKDLRNLRDGTQ